MEPTRESVTEQSPNRFRRAVAGAVLAGVALLGIGMSIDHAHQHDTLNETAAITLEFLGVATLVATGVVLVAELLPESETQSSSE